MLNYFHVYAVNIRGFIPDNSSAIQARAPPSYGKLLCLELQDILPTRSDKQQLLEHYNIQFARVICESVPFFKKNFSDCVPHHIKHDYSEQMSQKSEVVSHTRSTHVRFNYHVCFLMKVLLGVLFHSEQYNDDMRDILKKVYKYVPSVPILTDSGEGSSGSQQKPFPILFGGDQLTAERARTVKNVLSNSDSASSRLEGLILVSEDWHAKMCLYKVKCMEGGRSLRLQ